MTISDMLMILAVLLAPLLAVQVQKWLEDFRAQRERQHHIFKTLMATRANGLSHEHVQALNLIDLEFSGDKFRNTRDAWKYYLDLLGDCPNGEGAEIRFPIWNEKKADLLASLLMEMGKPLGYHFDTVHIKKGIYLPEGHNKLETEYQLIRGGLIKLLYGDASLKMDVQSLPMDVDAFESQKELVLEWLKTLRSDVGVPIYIKSQGL